MQSLNATTTKSFKLYNGDVLYVGDKYTSVVKSSAGVAAYYTILSIDMDRQVVSFCAGEFENHSCIHNCAFQSYLLSSSSNIRKIQSNEILIKE